MRKKIGVVFSKELQGNTPLSHIGSKLPVYLEFLEMLTKSGWDAYVLTRKTYLGEGVFKGGWLFKKRKFILKKGKLNIDLIYDRTGGVDFPPEDISLKVINPREFKILCWDKWATYNQIGKYMPKTFLIENEKEIGKYLPKIKTDKVVLKPFNGLKGLGIYIGNLKGAKSFSFPKKYSRYIMQEFVDTSSGIPNITPGMHDLRVVLVNGKVVWCHVRVPHKGKLTANAAQGGNLTEVNYAEVPDNIKEIVKKISTNFTKKFGDTVYSLDFGVDKKGSPKIFEINDQIGFPRVDMENKKEFLQGLVKLLNKKLKSA